MSNFAINAKLAKSSKKMNHAGKTISENAIKSEWQEILAAKKNPSFFKPIYERYYLQIFRFIYKRVASESLAADICSQVFTKAIQNLDKYQFKGVPYSAFLYRVASNEITSHFRKTQKNRIVSFEDAQLHIITDEMEKNISQHSTAELLRALDELPLLKMQMIEMRYFEKRSFREIAEILEITESNAKVKTYRILEKLKKIIVANKNME